MGGVQLAKICFMEKNTFIKTLNFFPQFSSLFNFRESSQCYFSLSEPFVMSGKDLFSVCWRSGFFLFFLPSGHFLPWKRWKLQHLRDKMWQGGDRGEGKKGTVFYHVFTGQISLGSAKIPQDFSCTVRGWARPSLAVLLLGWDWAGGVLVLDHCCPEDLLPMWRFCPAQSFSVPWVSPCS